MARMKNSILFLLFITAGVVFYFFRHPSDLATNKVQTAARNDPDEIPTAKQTIKPIETTSPAVSSAPQATQTENASSFTPVSSISSDPVAENISNTPPTRSLPSSHIKLFTDLAQTAKGEVIHTSADLLNGLQNINEFRPNATESVWNGNYIGEIGWSDRAPDSRLKPWPALINLEFKRPNEASPLTCFGILRNQRLLRFTKTSGKFVPMSDPKRNNYFVFRVGDTHYLQIILSDDLQGLAATSYIDDPEKGLIAMSYGLFRKNKSPTPEEASCE